MDGSWLETFSFMSIMISDYEDFLPSTYLQYYLYPKHMLSVENPEYTRANEVMDGKERRTFEMLDESFKQPKGLAACKLQAASPFSYLAVKTVRQKKGSPGHTYFPANIYCGVYILELPEGIMRSESYVIKSLELHLFFGRIMKEHSLFLRAGFTPADPSFSEQAEYFQKEFEKLLSQAVRLSGGVVGREVLGSGEVITEFTAAAEKETECLTGIPIDQEITARTQRLRSRGRQGGQITPQMRRQVQQLNKKALELLNGLICFKEKILEKVCHGEMFTMNYPLLIEHILREAKLYREYVQKLEKDGVLPDKSMKEIECFWNQIMMEHAQFIRGLLDPSETDLFDTADEFAIDYAELLETCCHAQDRVMTEQSLAKTVRLRDYKAAGTQGILQCKIRSVILPLLADHVLREANHYIRLLKH